ncbi:MAG: SPOR domain-containing protein [Phycisphaerae bacterium]|nr:SPOR domain-containing protein [Phycisphaerae bacterium]
MTKVRTGWMGGVAGARGVIARAAGCSLGAMVLAAVMVSGAALPGCGSSEKPKDNGIPSMPDYMQAYRKNDFRKALELASKAHRDEPEGVKRDRAAAVAGDSARWLGRNAEAERWVSPLLSSSDETVSGWANSTLGMIEKERGQHRQAADHLLAAAGKLRGSESASSWMYAGDALAAQGRKDEARQAYLSGLKEVPASNPQLKGMLDQRLGQEAPTSDGGGRYTIQVGAYSSRDRAQAAADRLRGNLAGTSLGSPRIVQVSSKGKILYTVRVGMFATREQAASGAKRLGTDATATLRTGE